MLDFRPKKPVTGVRFTLDRAEQLRQVGQRSLAKRRRWHGVFITLVIAAIVWLGYDWIRSASAVPPAAQHLDQEVHAPPMARPSLEGLSAMPSSNDIEAHAEAASAAIVSGIPPEWSGDTDALLLAWVRGITARDTAQPPLPQVTEAKDLMLRHLHVGSPVMISGQLLESLPAPLADGSPGWQRQIVMLEPQQYCLLLSPTDASNLPVGDALQAVGRFVGFFHVPVAANTVSSPAAPTDSSAPPASTAFVEVPLMIARQVHPRGSTSRGGGAFWETEGAFSVPLDVYDNVDDERLILETRAYYYTLGQVSRERSTPNVFSQAGNVNQQANDIHQAPANFRGKPFTVTGKVFYAWEDTSIARDQPFGVTRVARIILWSEDKSPITMDVKGTPTVVTKLVTRVYEIAAVSDQPLPSPGTIVTATGRFIRMRAMEVKPNPRSDAPAFTRQSDRSYTFFFATGAWTETLPDRRTYTWAWWNWLVMAIVISTAGWIVWSVRKSSAKESLTQDSVRKLRAIRQRKTQDKRAADSEYTPEKS